jgi:Zn-dependent protease with chaperone function
MNAFGTGRSRNSSIIAFSSGLKHDKPVVLRQQKAYAALKISSPKRFMDIFSTHPSMEKRIFALQKLNK